MSDQPQHVYCPHCGCETRAYRLGWSGESFDGQLRCVSCRHPFPGIEVQHAQAAPLTYLERCRAEFVRREIEAGKYTDHPKEVPA